MKSNDVVENGSKSLDIETVQPNEAQQATMLAIARRAISAHLERMPSPAYETDDPFMSYRAGLFVTLREKLRPGHPGPGRLRGCIGHMQADQPLYGILPEMAIQAATADPRFLPMQAEELANVTIEIAILSPLFPITRREEIDLGKHGLVLIGERQRALLLPKSPTIYGWDLDMYLANLHSKAGLPPNYWPRRGKLYGFTSFDFGE